MKGQRLLAKVCPAKAAQPANFGSDSPFFATTDKEAHNIARRQTAIHLISMVCSLLAALNRGTRYVRALDLHIPVRELREMLQLQHRCAVRFLAGRAGRAPDTQLARLAATLDQVGQQLRSQQFKRTPVSKEAGLIYRHRFSHRALERRVALAAKKLNQLCHTRYPLIAHHPGQAYCKEIVPRGVEYILRLFENHLAQKYIIVCICGLRYSRSGNG